MTIPVHADLLEELARLHGTPLYVMSGDTIRRRVQELRTALPEPCRLLYSVKANPAPGILALLAELGLDFDVCSPGDIAFVEAAGCAPKRMSYVGSGTSRSELETVVTRGIPFIADSLTQVERYGALRPGGALGLRLNPSIRAGFHPDVQAGRSETKFGLSEDQVELALALAAQHRCKVIGLHAHIGSEVPTHHYHVQLLGALLEWAARIPTVAWVNLGGGWSTPIADERAMPASSYDLDRFGRDTASALAAFETTHGRAIEVRIEPGSYLVMDAGWLLIRVTERKTMSSSAGDREVVLTDGGTDLVFSAAAYRTRHPVWSLRPGPIVPRALVLAGPLMQAGDVLAEDPWLPEVQVDDVLAVGMCGAYKSVRASNFNERTRPAEVLIDGSVVVLRDRETVEDLVGRYRPVGASATPHLNLGSCR